MKEHYEDFKWFRKVISNWNCETVTEFLFQNLGVIVIFFLLGLMVYVVWEILKNWLAPLVRRFSPKAPMKETPKELTTPINENQKTKREELLELSNYLKDVDVLPFKIPGLGIPFEALYKASLQQEENNGKIFQEPQITHFNTTMDETTSLEDFQENHILKRNGGNMVILGGSGVGKSMLLKKCFLDLCERHGDEIALYATVADLLKDEPSKAMKEVLNVLCDKNKNSSSKVYVFLDGLDEVKWGNGELKCFCEKLYESYCTVIVTCRRNFYEREIKEISKFFEYTVHPWEIEQSLSFARAYFNNDEVLIKKATCLLELGESPENNSPSLKHTKEDILTNPFALSLFLRLLKTSKEKNEEMNQRNCHIYGLYQSYIEDYLVHETSRRRKKKKRRVISPQDWQTLMEIANKNYKGEEANYSGRNRGIRRLLGLSDESNEIRFPHQSIRDFLVARKIVEELQADDDKWFKENFIELLGTQYRNDVKRFVKDAFRMMKEDIPGYNYKNTSHHLQALIKEIEPEEIKNDLDFYHKNQIIYYGTRFENKTTESEELAKTILDLYNKIENATDQWDALLRQSIIYGLSILATRLGEVEDLDSADIQKRCWKTIYSFAVKLKPGTNADKLIRTWALVNYGDVHRPNGESVTKYVDDGKDSWFIARERRISRLSKPERTAYRILDLKVLFLFHESRSWGEIKFRLKDFSWFHNNLEEKWKTAKKEVRAVWECEHSLPANCGKEIKALVQETRTDLLKGYIRNNPLLFFYICWLWPKQVFVRSRMKG